MPSNSKAEGSKGAADKGSVAGLDGKDQVGESSLPPTVTAAQVNEANRKYWQQPASAGEDFGNE